MLFAVFDFLCVYFRFGVFLVAKKCDVIFHREKLSWCRLIFLLERGADRRLTKNFLARYLLYFR